MAAALTRCQMIGAAGAVSPRTCAAYRTHSGQFGLSAVKLTGWGRLRPNNLYLRRRMGELPTALRAAAL